MSEGAPDYRATEGPASMDVREAIGDAYARAYDELVEHASLVRQHVCLHPFHVDVSPEFLDELRRFALAMDALAAAEEAVEDDAFREDDSTDAGAGAASPIYRAGFAAGAILQHASMVKMANARSWVKIASAMHMMPIVESPISPIPPAAAAQGEAS